MVGMKRVLMQEPAELGFVARFSKNDGRPKRKEYHKDL